MGQNALEMRLFLSNANEFLCAGALNFANNTTANHYGPATTFTPITTELSYTLSDVRMNYDVCMTSDSYNNALKSYLASSRLTLPIDTYYSTVFDLPQSAGWVNHTISTQMSDISAVYVGFVRGSEQSSYAFCGGDRFFKPIGLTEARIMINGRPLPNVNIRLSGNPVLPEAEAYHYLLKALKQGSGTLEVVGNTNQYRDGIRTIVHATAAGATPNREKSWLQSTGMAYGVQRVPVPTEGTGANAGIFTPNRWTDLSNPYASFATITTADNWLSSDAHFWESPSQFILGFDTSKSNYASEYELAGTDLSRSSGLIQLQLKFDAAATDLRAIILVRHKRLLDIGLESSQVIY
jgi:hypothetical protein